MAQTFTYLTDANGQIWQIGIQTDGSIIQTPVSSVPGDTSAPVNLIIPSITGQQLFTLAQNNLMGRANLVNSDQLLSFLNLGKDEVWLILKELKNRLFLTSTQPTNNTLANYFPPLDTTTREYALPSDFADLDFIEVVAPSGYETVKFTQKSLFTAEFRAARVSALSFQSQGNAAPLVGFGGYLFDIVGRNTFMLAQFPETNFTLKLWYVRTLPEITLNSSQPIDQILYPFNKRIADYATMRILMNDPAEFGVWRETWRQDIINMVQGADRNSSDPIFVQGVDDQEY